MSFHRTTFVAIATFFTVGMTSVAFAGCGGWGGWGSGGCGGASFAPVTYAVPLSVYAVPVTTYAQPIAPAPIGVGGCGCGSAGYAEVSVAPAPVYVVNQGPEYSGPGIMEPFRTYAPAAYAPTASYPYISGYRSHRYYPAAPRFAYGAHVSYRPHYYGPRSYGPRVYRAMQQWHLYPHHS